MSTHVMRRDVPASARRPQAGELVYGLRRDAELLTCELRDHGEAGVEIQFVRNGEFQIGHRFETRANATHWAEVALVEFVRQGWTEAA